jgi:toxin ParE1/3/4
VGHFRLTRRAENDLLDIGRYTIRTWGLEQCAHYLDELEACCQRLADNPLLGRACEHIRPGYWRMEQGRHVIFYRIEKDSIIVSRFLHARMLPQLHLGEENEE